MKRLAHPQALIAVALIATGPVRPAPQPQLDKLAGVRGGRCPRSSSTRSPTGSWPSAFGDDTAQRAGRLTLNPVRHIDPFGTLVLPGVLACAGWGASVTPNRSRSTRPGCAAPATTGGGEPGRAGDEPGPGRPVGPDPAPRPAGRGRPRRVYSGHVVASGSAPLDLTDRVLFLLGFVNVTLAVFNALPIPPLDGSAVVARLLPRSAMPVWYSYQRTPCRSCWCWSCSTPATSSPTYSGRPSGPGPTSSPAESAGVRLTARPDARSSRRRGHQPDARRTARARVRRATSSARSAPALSTLATAAGIR